MQQTWPTHNATHQNTIRIFLDKIIEKQMVEAYQDTRFILVQIRMHGVYGGWYSE